MRSVVIGIVVLLVAIGICWADVYLWQGHGGDWVAMAIGAERAGSDMPMVDTVFNLGVFVPLVIVGLVAGLIERRNAAALGRAPIRAFAVGLLVGLAGLSVSIAYARLAGALSGGAGVGATPAILAWGFAVVAVQTGAEEIYFRGWLQPALVARWGRWPGIIAGALAFGVLHVAGGARAPMALLNLFLGGMMFGLLAWRTGGLAAAIGTHWAWNGAEQMLYGVDPNPGIGSFGALFDFELQGAAIWGGSAEGLNTSVGMTVALLAILAPLVALSWRRDAAAAAKAPPVIKALPADKPVATKAAKPAKLSSSAQPG